MQDSVGTHDTSAEARLLRRPNAARFLGISVSTFDRLRKDGGLPAPRVIGGLVAWDRRDLHDYASKLPYECGRA